MLLLSTMFPLVLDAVTVRQGIWIYLFRLVLLLVQRLFSYYLNIVCLILFQTETSLDGLPSLGLPCFLKASSAFVLSVKLSMMFSPLTSMYASLPADSLTLSSLSYSSILLAMSTRNFCVAGCNALMYPFGLV